MDTKVTVGEGSYESSEEIDTIAVVDEKYAEALVLLRLVSSEIHIFDGNFKIFTNY